MEAKNHRREFASKLKGLQDLFPSSKSPNSKKTLISPTRNSTSSKKLKRGLGFCWGQL
jgi:hypothetical protein